MVVRKETVAYIYVCIYIPSVHKENIEVDEKTKQDDSNIKSKLNRKHMEKMMSILPQAIHHHTNDLDHLGHHS